MTSFKIGVVSDTHVPDRTSALEEQFLMDLQAEKVDLILLGGDISTRKVIDQLERIAPVVAVRGNRDFLLRRQLPMTAVIEQFGVKIVLMHGHMGFFTYWSDKLQYIFKGYDKNRYISRLVSAVPDARVYVFGHTHHAENFWQDGKLFFNPGSITYGDVYTRQCSWGVIEIQDDGKVDSRIILFKES
jgi:uncharacterized protein